MRSLTFECNKRTYGQYGVQQGKYFTLPISKGNIVGFHGKFGWYLDTIGVYIEPTHKASPISSVVRLSNNILSFRQNKALSKDGEL